MKRIFLVVVIGVIILVYFVCFHRTSPKVPVLKFDERLDGRSFDFTWGDLNDPYLIDLRTRYDLEGIISGSKNDLERVEKLCHWVHGLWKHNGRNEPIKKGPISIIEEAKRGKRFRCVEYSVVLSGCLNAVGIPARIVSLMTKDVETRKSGAGHVVVEAYLRDMEKWIFVDPQWDVIPCLDGVPLNAVEFQRMLAKRKKELGILSLSRKNAHKYFRWISPYLYYFAVKFDNRVWKTDVSSKRVMLVPIGAREPKVFQRRFPMYNVIYTHSINSFYPEPQH